MYKKFDNVLSPIEIKLLLEYERLDDDTLDLRPDVRSKNPQWDQDDFPQDILARVLDKVLPDPYQVETVLFYRSQISFRLHTDSGVCENDTIYRNVLLPLAFDGPATTVLFDHHYTGPATRFARSDIGPFRYNLPDREGKFVWVDDIRNLLHRCKSNPEAVTEFDVTNQFVVDLEQLIDKRQHANDRRSDYSSISNYVPGRDIDQAMYQKYLYHMPKEDLQGLTVETVYHWVKGGALTWPRTQLHCAGAGHQQKIGVSIFTKRR